MVTAGYSMFLGRKASSDQAVCCVCVEGVTPADLKIIKGSGRMLVSESELPRFIANTTEYLARKTQRRRFMTEISLADDFQCHGTAQIDIDRFVSRRSPSCANTRTTHFD
jgi:hypothetical protein